MVERDRIIALASRDRAAAGVLVTLVRTLGSTYRKPGARMLAINGESVGTISGGCLEAEVIRKAKWAVQSGATVQRYSTLFDETSDIPYGLGCGGTVDLLLEPSGTPEFAALLRALEDSQRAVAAQVITFLPNEAGPLKRAILRSGNLIFGSKDLSASRIDAAVAGELDDVFVERLEPPQRLVILGAGGDVQPLVRLANLLGWRVVVADGRRQLARPERFPEAERVVQLSRQEMFQIGIKSDDAVVVMTHSYEQDRDWLAAVLPIGPRYLGVLGARHRSSLLLSEVSAMIGLSISACCERICAPIGLDLGGEGPEAIALSIMAEAQACCEGKLSLSRRLSPSDVLMQITRGNTTQYIQAQCALELSAG